MNLKRYLAATIALFLFIFLFEWLTHGFLLLNLYEQTVSVWRDFSEMDADIPLTAALQFILAAWTTFAFSQFYPEGGLLNGLRFGIFIGVFAGILTATWYFWLPVPAILGWSWFLVGLCEGIGGGIILGLIYKKKKESAHNSF